MLAALNSRHHKVALYLFMAIVLAHLAEHVVQAVQIFVLDMPRPASRGVLGQFFPWVVTSEALHYGYALVMLVGLLLLRPGFTGSSRLWWNVALWIQVWHHFEHLLLQGQAIAGATLFGQPERVSVLQLVFPRVELHLAYNTAVLVPMLVAMWLHRRPRAGDPVASCSCASHHPARVEPAPAGA